MMGKASCLASSLALSFIIVVVTSTSEARHMQTLDQKPLGSSATLSATQRDSPAISKIRHVLIRQNSSPGPPICRARQLDPRVKCGCFGYRNDYLGNPEWQLLENACLAELNNDISSGFLECDGTGFTTSTGRFVFGVMNSFFQRARATCVDPGINIPTRQISMLRGDTDVDDFIQGTISEKYELDSINSPVVRIPPDFLHRKLANFCLVTVFQVRGKSPNDAFCDCCPRHPKCKTSRPRNDESDARNVNSDNIGIGNGRN